MTDEKYEVTDGARGVLYGASELRNAKISAARRSRIPHTQVQIVNVNSREVVAVYQGGKPTKFVSFMEAEYWQRLSFFTPLGETWVSGRDQAHDGTPIVWLTFSEHPGYGAATIEGTTLCDFEVDGQSVEWDSITLGDDK